MEDKYSVLIRFDDQSSTDAFYKHFNGRHFSSLEVCFALSYFLYFPLMLKSFLWKLVLLSWMFIFCFVFLCLQVEACHVLFTFDVQYTGSIEHAQSTPASSTEQPSCVVCLGLFLYPQCCKLISISCLCYDGNCVFLVCVT